MNATKKNKTAGSAPASTTGAILPIIQQDNQLLIDARLLHQRLQVKEKFSDWIKRRIEEYQFKKDEDFYCNFRKTPPDKGNEFFRNLGKTPENRNEPSKSLITEKSVIKNKRGGGRKSVEYFFTLDTGKELAMLEKNEAGRAIRRYFIEAEKQLRSARLYAATATFTELNRAFKPILLNGRKLYPFRAVAISLGYHPGISISRFSERGWGALFVKIGNKTYCAEEYVKVMMARAKSRVMVAEARAAQPVLPENFGEMPQNKKGGSHE